jgi:hypothetical protein
MLASALVVKTAMLIAEPGAVCGWSTPERGVSRVVDGRR